MEDIELPDVLTSDDVPGMRAAELVIDGLSVFCFNKFDPKEPFWEVAYPRQGRHDLTIKIQELDGDGNKVGAERSHPIDRQVQQFNIHLTNGSLAHYQQDHFPEGGPWADDFSRDLTKDDPTISSGCLIWRVMRLGTEIL